MSTIISIPKQPSTYAVKSSRNNVINNTVQNKVHDATDIFSMGLEVLYSFLDVLSNLASTNFKGMQARSKYANDTQDMSNQVDKIIAEAAKGDDKTKEALPDAVIDFMKKNGISVDGMSIDDYLQKYGPELDKGQLQAVKAALDNEKNRATDTMSQDQLQLQKVMQNYNVCANNISTLQSGLKDLLMTIARNLC
ncbi:MULTISPECIES: chemotaxis protein [Yersinia]|uniref:chemotaxis protein n=1 Tax=Yersinia TaxID=629 RepID=UPI0005E7A911|nr:MULTISPECIES: chemotaxis protein [Yersinia]OVZ95779.1 chemotaxis protein [Yersinia frederiksenii]RXA94360.1 chemotaxis protein [Yersinia sp. 2105 StPb PI]CNI63110.1 Methyl-accepting chemotaxis protein [Yersinia frederiksenii]CNJ24740.1 Methyl-accepting chemotaxis protein [Yersinia frederiksenii]CNK66905.1 Methyl-accepting chemotaxis protein [Yersinia frederiksenii]